MATEIKRGDRDALVLDPIATWTSLPFQVNLTFVPRFSRW